MIKIVRNKINVFTKKLLGSKLKWTIPFSGFKPSEIVSSIDTLTDSDLIKINQTINWNCFTVDSHGRRLGSVAWGAKRIEPQIIPDPRIFKMHTRFDLHNKHVLEVGCFEGVHTLGLLEFTNKVTAVDSRIEHVIKTLIRVGLYGKQANVFKCDLDDASFDYNKLSADFLHHVGVLYHLKDPIQHLLRFGKFVKFGLMLDTHYALDSEVTHSYIVDGREYKYKKYLEFGEKEVFSGMYDHSKWLLLEDIINCLKLGGFTKVDIVEQRQERNGPRVLLFAERDL